MIIEWEKIENMTLEVAEKIMMFRFHPNGDWNSSWRSVAFQAGDKDHNQLYGMDLCKKAKEVLADKWLGGEDY